MFNIRQLGRAVLKPELFFGRTIINLFHSIYYANTDCWHKNRFLDFPIYQCPFDMHAYQELIFRIKPSYILQTGVAEGGSIVYFCNLLDLIKAPDSTIVIGIDIKIQDRIRHYVHPRIRLIEGSSTSQETMSKVSKLIQQPNGLICLDSDHSAKHVAEELRLYSTFVSVGSYLVVEDTNINGHPVLKSFGPGPLEAVRDFLAQNKHFEQDDCVWKRNLFSFHQKGWLVRRY